MDVEERSTLVCRICQDTGGDMLENICKCRGSMACVHETCLKKWIDARDGNKMSCEICKATFDIDYAAAEEDFLHMENCIIPMLIFGFFGFNFIISVTCALIFFVPGLHGIFLALTPIAFFLFLFYVIFMTLKIRRGQKFLFLITSQSLITAPVILVLFLLGFFLEKKEFFYAMFAQLASLLFASIAFLVSRM